MSFAKPTLKPRYTTTTGPIAINIDREISSRDNDMLGWHNQAERLGQYLMFHLKTPIIIGVQGDWGSGKSSFINLVEQSLGTAQALSDAQLKEHPLAVQLRHYECHKAETASPQTAHVYVLRFDSWAFAQSQHAADALFPIYVSRAIEDYLRATKKLPVNSPALSAQFAKIGKAGLVTAAGVFGGEAAGKAVDVAIAASQPENGLVDQISSFKRDFQKLVDLLLGSTGADYSNRLLVIVDDLDRISPVTAVDITEKIKVFLDVSGVIFILAADLSIIQQGLRQKFGEAAQSAGKNYLDKIVKIQYNVPRLEAMDLAGIAVGYPTFMDSFGLKRNTPPEALLERDFFTLLRLFPTIGSNLRNSKRVLLNFEFSYYLLSAAHHPGPDDAFRLLATTILYQYDHALAEAFYRWLADPAHSEDLAVGLDALGSPGAPLGQLDIPESHSRVVQQFFEILLERKYTVKQWRTTYTATTMAAETGQ